MFTNRGVTMFSASSREFTSGNCCRASTVARVTIGR